MTLNRRLFLQHTGLGALGFIVANSLPRFSFAADDSALPRSAPDTQNVSSASIFNFINAVEEKKMPLHSLMILKNGQVIAEGWWKPYAPQLHHSLYSLSKSFCSTAVIESSPSLPVPAATAAGPRALRIFSRWR